MNTITKLVWSACFSLASSLLYISSISASTLIPVLGQGIHFAGSSSNHSGHGLSFGTSNQSGHGSKSSSHNSYKGSSHRSEKKIYNRSNRNHQGYSKPNRYNSGQRPRSADRHGTKPDSNYVPPPRSRGNSGHVRGHSKHDNYRPGRHRPPIDPGSLIPPRVVRDPGPQSVPPPRTDPVWPSPPQAPQVSTTVDPGPAAQAQPRKRTKKRKSRKRHRHTKSAKTTVRTPKKSSATPSTTRNVVDPLSPNNYVPRQVVIAASTTNGRTDFYKALAKKGYKIQSMDNYTGLGLAVSVYKVPANSSVPKALKEIKSMYPNIIVDANHLYGLHNAADANKEDSIKKRLIGWGPVPTQCGKGLKIGLLDTEVEEKHRMFKGKKISHKSFLPSGNTPAPKAHATAITSIWIGNKGGLAPSAEIYVASVFKREKDKVVNTRTRWLLSGMEWLINQKVDVINLSFGGPVNKVFEQAITNAQSKGIIFVASAGNNGPTADPVYPAAHKKVVAVTAIDNNLNIYKKANQGEYIDFAAPGVNIRVANPDDGEKFVSGTSFAAPYVAAALVLLKKHKQEDLETKLKYLQSNSKDLGEKGKDNSFGWGLIQVKNACDPNHTIVADSAKNSTVK